MGELPGVVRQVLETIPDGVFVSDTLGRIVFVNERAEQMTGYRRDELAGRDVETLVPDELRAVHQNHREIYYQYARRRPMGVTPDIKVLRKDGVAVPVDISLGVIRIESAPFIISTMRDATQRVEAATSAREEAGRAAVTTDRERIGAALLRVVVPGLFELGMDLQAATAKLNAGEEFGARISRIVDGLDAAIRDIRECVYGLRGGEENRDLERVESHGSSAPHHG